LVQIWYKVFQLFYLGKCYGFLKEAKKVLIMILDTIKETRELEKKLVSPVKKEKTFLKKERNAV
jgi:hypothetical protein